MATLFDKFSYLNFFDLITVRGFTFWEPILLADISAPRDDDIKVVVTKSDRIDLLAHRFYGTPQLWWIIALANNMRNISTDFRPGTEIRIPSSDFIDDIFGSR